MEKIVKPSADRIEIDCKYFPKCGGCSLRHISYDSELKIKEKFVYDAFTRIGNINTEFYLFWDVIYLINTGIKHSIL